MDNQHHTNSRALDDAGAPHHSWVDQFFNRQSSDAYYPSSELIRMHSRTGRDEWSSWCFLVG